MASIFDKQLLSTKDLERMNELDELYAKATDEKTKNDIYNLAESIRYGYGYSGGADGNGYEVINNATVGTATALNSYTAALRDASQAELDAIEKQKLNNTLQGNERLRQAYIKNMQQKLSIGDTLVNNGISGGVAEGTIAVMDNEYLKLRDSILKDVADTNNELDIKGIQSKHQTESEIGKLEYDAATERADRLTEAEQAEFERSLAQMQLALERDELDYQKLKDELDRKYQIEKDALDRANELKKANISKSASTKNEELEARKKEAWMLLEKGVFEESFPELLGFSKEILLEYAENCMAGF